MDQSSPVVSLSAEITAPLTAKPASVETVHNAEHLQKLLLREAALAMETRGAGRALRPRVDPRALRRADGRRSRGSSRKAARPRVARRGGPLIAVAGIGRAREPDRRSLARCRGPLCSTRSSPRRRPLVTWSFAAASCSLATLCGTAQRERASEFRRCANGPGARRWRRRRCRR